MPSSSPALSDTNTPDPEPKKNPKSRPKAKCQEGRKGRRLSSAGSRGPALGAPGGSRNFEANSGGFGIHKSHNRTSSASGYGGGVYGLGSGRNWIFQCFCLKWQLIRVLVSGGVASTWRDNFALPYSRQDTFSLARKTEMSWDTKAGQDETQTAKHLTSSRPEVTWCTALVASLMLSCKIYGNMSCLAMWLF